MIAMDRHGWTKWLGDNHHGWTKWQRVWILISLAVIVVLLAVQVFLEGHP